MSITSARPREQAVARILELADNPRQGENPRLVVAIGLPGSGKSTFCRQLARETGAVVLESDALRRELFGTPTYSREESRQLFDAIHEAVRQLLKQGAHVILDATNLKEQHRRPAYETADATGAELLLLHFQAPREVITNRLAGRGRSVDPMDRSSADITIHTRMAETEEPVSRAHWLIDTSDAGATRAALQRAIEAIEPRSRKGEGRSTGGSNS